MRALTGMTGIRLLATTLILAGVPLPASAQQEPPDRAPLVRTDLVGSLGWLNAEADAPGLFDRWYHRSLYGGVGVGWYWTDHLKTEVDFGASTPAELYASDPVAIGAGIGYRLSRLEFSTKGIAAVQQYQFYRNRWFHPHIGIGMDAMWQTIKRRDDPVFWYDPVAREGRQVQPARTHGPETDLRLRPFVSAGFKAYLSQRGFFRSDLRVVVRDGVDEVLLRFGFGVDF